MDTRLEKMSLRFHETLLKYHKAGLGWNITNGWAIAAFYHALCVGVEMFAVAYHKHQLRKMKGGNHVQDR